MSAIINERSELIGEIRKLITRVRTLGALAEEHKVAALDWLDSTTDIFRRSKPRTPTPHLVSYFLLVDRGRECVLLCDHRLSGLWLPTGGHVDPDEHPAETVRREAREELGLEAEFDAVFGENPFFLTVTDTVRSDLAHTDVSLWFALNGSAEMDLRPDQREFHSVRWWSRADLDGIDPKRVEPHLVRALDVLAANAP